MEVPPAPSQGVIALADQVRRWGMYLLLWSFMGTVGLSLLAAMLVDGSVTRQLLRGLGGKDCELAVTLADRPFDHLKQLLQILLPAETALLGSAMGFYYGSRTRNPGDREMSE